MNNNTSNIAMFVFVRNDLNNINKAVQAGHACFEYIKKYSNSSDFVPKLTRLGSPEWEKTKLRVKQKVKEIIDKK